MKDILREARPELQEALEQLELQRQELKSTKKTEDTQAIGAAFGCLSPVIVMVVLPILKIDLAEYSNLILWAGLILGGVLIMVTRNTHKKYKKQKSKFRLDFKQNVFKVLLKYLAPNTLYFPDKTFRKTVFKESKLFNYKGSLTIEGDDFFEGKLNNKSFLLGEILATATTTYRDSEGTHTQIKTVFNGILLRAELPLHIDGFLVIEPRNLAAGLKRKIGYFIGVDSREEFTNLSSNKYFNENFRVFASSRKLEEPLSVQLVALIELLCDLKETLNYPIQVSLNQKYVSIAIEAPIEKNFFSVKLNQPLDKMLVWEESKHSSLVLDAGTRESDTQLEGLLEETAFYLDLVDRITKLNLE